MHQRTEEIKGSSFIAWVSQVSSLEEIDTDLAAIRARYPDASHHCYAYKLDQQMRFSDDGEPGGTAGRPMLEVFQKRNLDFVLGVVTRYFGGTKLGAGGLVRAYSGSLAKALDEAGEMLVKDRLSIVIAVPFSVMDAVHRYLNDFPDLTKGELSYTQTGMTINLNLLAEDEDRLKTDLINLSRGELVWHLGEK